MDNIKKEFNKQLLENLGSILFKRFKQQEFYTPILKTLQSINDDKNINNDRLTLIKRNINKLNLKLGREITFIFCGTFMFKGKKIILLELSEKIGTYYFEDAKIVRQLSDYKIGLKLRLKKTKEGVEMVLPYTDNNNIGLFEKI